MKILTIDITIIALFEKLLENKLENIHNKKIY